MLSAPAAHQPLQLGIHTTEALLLLVTPGCRFLLTDVQIRCLCVFHNVYCASGDELGRVTVKDFQGTEAAKVENIHSRRVNGLAFSSHRYIQNKLFYLFKFSSSSSLKKL